MRRGPRIPGPQPCLRNQYQPNKDKYHATFRHLDIVIRMGIPPDVSTVLEELPRVGRNVTHLIINESRVSCQVSLQPDLPFLPSSQYECWRSEHAAGPESTSGTPMDDALLSLAAFRMTARKRSVVR